MIKLHALIATNLFKCVICFAIFHKEEKSYIDLKLFWDVFKTHYFFVNTIKITTFATEEKSSELENFTQEFLRNFYKNNVSKNLYVWKNNNTFPTTNNGIIGHVVIILNEEALNNCLNHGKHEELFTRMSKTLNFIIFTHLKVSTVSTNLYQIFQQLWDKYTILNSVAFFPNQDDNLILFNPFANNGRLKTISLLQAVNNENLLINTIDNLNNCPLSVSMFERYPSAIKLLPKLLRNNPLYNNLSSSGGFTGLDGILLANLASCMNFTPKIIYPSYSNYGFVTGNGTILGSLGDVATKKVFISLNGRFISDYGTDEIEFTFPFSDDLLCFVVPKSSRIPQWMMIFHCFKLKSWILILSNIFLCFCVLYLLQKNRRVHAGTVFLQVFALMISVPLKLPKTHKLFLTSLILFNIIIVGIFQGSLIKSFSTDSFYEDINTLEALEESDYFIATTLKVFGEESTPIMQKLGRKIRDISETALEAAAYKRKIVALERQNDAKLYIETIYIKNDGTPLLHICKECPLTFFISYIVPKGSPLLRKFDSVIVSFHESGLTYKWYRDVIGAIIHEKQLRFVASQSALKALDLPDMQTPFFILIIGVCFACVIFFVEIVYSKRKAKRFEIVEAKVCT